MLIFSFVTLLPNTKENETSLYTFSLSTVWQQRKAVQLMVLRKLKDSAEKYYIF